MAASALERDVLAGIDQAQDRIVETLQTLVGFETPNPPGGNERPLQEWMAARLAALGMEVDVFDALPGRPNVVGRLPGNGGGRSAMFNGHIDVAELRAPEAWTRSPFDAVVSDGRVYGLGSSDMKSAHAGFLAALDSLAAAGVRLAGDVIYESVIGEERGERGTVACIERGIHADFAIVGECSKAEAIIVTSVGAINVAVTVRDSSTYHLIQRRPREGRSHLAAKNCIEKMATVVIPALLDLEERWGSTKQHPLLPPNQAMINVFSIGSGGNTFIIPNECVAAFTIVYLPNERVEDVQAEVERHLAEAVARDDWFAAHPLGIAWDAPAFPIRFAPIDTPIDHPGVALLAQCLSEASGRPPHVGGRDAIMDGGWLFREGIPTVVFGPGDKTVIHAPDEYVELADVVAFAKTCALFLMRWSGAQHAGQTASSP